MSSRINGLKLRRTFGVKHWYPPVPYGDDGFFMINRGRTSSVIVNAFDWMHMEPTRAVPDPPSTYGSPFPIREQWVHASISHTDHMPDYEDLTTLHRAVWSEDGWAYQMFVPKANHVNIRQFALHLWGRLDGRPAMPDFVGTAGTI